MAFIYKYSYVQLTSRFHGIYRIFNLNCKGCLKNITLILLLNNFLNYTGLNCTILHQKYRNEIIPLNSHSLRIRIYLVMRVTRKTLALMSKLTLIGK